jgi:hypothetical protein
MPSPALVIVGADKGGVGKTTLSRLLIDYLQTHGTAVRAFDAEFPRGTLKRFHPDITEVVDLTQTSDQMKILDTLENTGARVSVVDIRAGRLGPTLKTLQEIGFLEAVRDRLFTFALFHVLGPSISSLEEISTVAPFVSHASYFTVKNHINDTTFFEWDPDTYKSYFGGVKSAGEISIPKLDELAYERVELAGVPFSRFVENRTGDNESAHHSFVLRGHTRNWMKHISAEFDRIKFLEIVAPKKSKK